MLPESEAELNAWYTATRDWLRHQGHYDRAITRRRSAHAIRELGAREPTEWTFRAFAHPGGLVRAAARGELQVRSALRSIRLSRCSE
jgi:hypothetical protein